MNKRVVRLLSMVGAIVMVVPMLAAMPAARTEAAAQAQAGAAPSKTVTYCSPGGVDLKMDMYLPKSTGKPVPALLYIHGGGWTSGDRTQVNNVLNAADLTARGYVVAAIDYRLAPQYKWPAQIEDAKCAVRYLRTNAATYGIDPSRIGTWGESSGAHLAAMLGMTDPSAGFEGKEGKLDQSTTVQTVVDMSGPTDFSQVQTSPLARSMSQSLLGLPLDKAGPTMAKASPVNYVNGNDPSFLIIQGEKDPIVPASQSQALYDKLRATGVPATLVMVKNGGHVFAPTGGAISPTLPQIQQTVYNYFDSVLKAPKANAQYFAPTGKVAKGKFLDYWTRNGGLAQQGYPISEEMQEKNETDGKVYTVQYFERAVMELHPENKAPYDVLLSLLGNFKYKQRYGAAGAPGQKPNTTAGSQLFPQTGKRVGGRFLQYWQQNGGLAQQGYPISDEFQEKNELNGQTYTVQYFERAVMEYHPENKAPYDVLLSQLGTFRYKDQAPAR